MLRITIAAALLLMTSLVFAGAISKSISTISEFEQAVNEYAAAKPDDKILVVFDIDDTLLESAGFYGGDTWYNWSRGKNMSDQNGKPLVIDDANKTACIFSKLGVIFELARHHATEPSVAAMVAKMQTRHSVMALTSRSPDYRGGTERELMAAGINFTPSHLMAPMHALAYQMQGIGGRIAKVSYQDGIVMSSGLNKGVVLDDLLTQKLAKTDVYDAIFFIDDGQRNIDNMTNHYKDSNKVVRSYLYTGVDKRISEPDIATANDARDAFNAFIGAAFKQRDSEFKKGEC